MEELVHAFHLSPGHGGLSVGMKAASLVGLPLEIERKDLTKKAIGVILLVRVLWPAQTAHRKCHVGSHENVCACHGVTGDDAVSVNAARLVLRVGFTGDGVVGKAEARKAHDVGAVEVARIEGEANGELALCVPGSCCLTAKRAVGLRAARHVGAGDGHGVKKDLVARRGARLMCSPSCCLQPTLVQEGHHISHLLGHQSSNNLEVCWV